MSDVLHTMFEELRRDLPPLPHMSQGDERVAWLSAVKQVVQAMPPTQQWACCVLLADDLVKFRYPGMELSMAYAWLSKELEVRDVTE